jgi:hypothetical protein
MLPTFLNVYRSSVVIRDRLCVGDSVVIKDGPKERMRGNVTQNHQNGTVTVEGDYGHVSVNVATFVSDSFALRYSSILARCIYQHSKKSIPSSFELSSTKLSVNR